ncbi:hypothetical protein DCAR_0728273 [Daucus carota subsp. sativus]|uniref:Uncharacterized protein n=1 Tax=Daucus carota subsp. sativus TaxID=79200 RepID=A0A175YBR2_DAUCS|nr:hypothetical protein DCAR_0728273 [Daucus carota subsp. sativus]
MTIHQTSFSLPSLFAVYNNDLKGVLYAWCLPEISSYARKYVQDLYKGFT